MDLLKLRLKVKVCLYHSNTATSVNFFNKKLKHYNHGETNMLMYWFICRHISGK